MRAAAHNRLAAMARRKVPRYVREPNPVYEHPWFTSVAWDGAKETWVARVRAGFVNGMDPAVPGLVDGQGRVVTLCDAPEIPLRDFRDGFEGISAAARMFFQWRGAVEPKQDNIVIENDSISIHDTDDSGDPKGDRRLMAMDFYLAQARASMRGVAEVVDGTGISGQVVQYATAYNTTTLERHGTRARLQQARAFPKTMPEPTFEELLLGNYGDDGEDRLPVCTVFLLGPEGEDGVPDGRWIPYVQHHLFWNVMYASRYMPSPAPPAPITLYTGLLGGLADSIFNQLLAPGNDMAAAAFAAMSGRVPQGRFYTI